MKTQSRLIIHGFWGGRPVSPADTATRIKETFATLTSLGEPLSGPWTADFVDPVNVDDDSAILRCVVGSPVEDDKGHQAPEDGYQPRFYLGDYQLSEATQRDLGAFKVRASPHASENGPASSVILTFEGEGLVGPAREHARTLVQGLTRAWKPDYLAFTDSALLELRSKRVGRSLSGRPLPSWGYVAWLSDVVSRHVDVIEGATSERFGEGTLIETDTMDPQQASDVWGRLLDAKCLRPAPAAQDHGPSFFG